MKEILYRAKAINRREDFNYRTSYKNGDWVYGLIIRIDEYSTEMRDLTGVNGIDVDRDTVCEYTSLHDKNGNRVFDGDIINVQYGGESVKGVIKFHEYNACWLIHIVKYNRHLHPFNHPEMEVIGNIFDNPKMLEVE